MKGLCEKGFCTDELPMGAPEVLSALAEERVGTPLDRVGPQPTVEAEALAGLSQEGEEDGGQSEEEAEPVAAVGAAEVDVVGSETESALDSLGFDSRFRGPSEASALTPPSIPSAGTTHRHRRAHRRWWS